jgi:nucleotide-binding universal stress UspA family protein
MGTVKAGQLRYLKLDNLAADPKLVRRLPPDLAWRYHALPLAEDHGRVTVAMAHPDDAVARDAVLAALGPASCVVEAEPRAIDALLTEIWGNETRHRLHLMGCDHPDSAADGVWDYALALGDLLGARVSSLNTEKEIEALEMGRKGAGCDLIVFGNRRHRLIRHLLSRPASDGELISRPRPLPFAVVVAQQPRWPLKSILLVLWGAASDKAAVDWAVHLAKPSGCSVTVLAVVPPVPIMYSQRAGMHPGLSVLLTSDTLLGQQMRRTARRLAECEIEGTLRLRQGLPDRQICREIAQGDHDLIVMATRPCRWALRQLKGDPICSLLSRVGRPMLLTEPTTV